MRAWEQCVVSGDGEIDGRTLTFDICSRGVGESKRGRIFLGESGN